VRSLLALRERDGVRVPDDVPVLVEAVYEDDALAVPAAWAADLADARRRLDAERREKARKGRQFLIPEPVGEDDILDRRSQDMRDDDDPAAPPELRALTRDADPAVPLVLLYEVGERTYFDPAGRAPADLARRPTLGDAERFVRQAVAVSHRGCVAHYLRRDPPPAWRRSGLLRFHRVCRLHAGGRAAPGEFPLTYDPAVGVEFPAPAPGGP
jgi:CRISPR-associated endonuclease/helicase Cas3